MAKPYSKAFTARQNPRRYLLSGIPPMLWENVRRQARKEHVSMRSLILKLLEGWLNFAPEREAAERGGPVQEILP